MAQVRPKRTAALPVRAGPARCSRLGQVQVQGIGLLRHGEQLKNRGIPLVLSHLSPPKVALALAKTGNKAVSRHGPRFCNRCRNDREVARLPLLTVAPARVTILTKAEGVDTMGEKGRKNVKKPKQDKVKKGPSGTPAPREPVGGAGGAGPRRPPAAPHT